MITFTENGNKLETWYDYISIPRQGELVKLESGIKGVIGVLNEQHEIKIIVK